MRVVVGIDPGNSGAVAVLGDGQLFAAYDMPVLDRVVSEALYVDLLRQIEVDHLIDAPAMCVIERVSAMPKQGVSTTFKFGLAYGIQRCGPAARGWPVTFVTPTEWKRTLKLSKDKEQSRRRAIELWPDQAQLFARKKDDGRAEAALIAHWWDQTHHPDATGITTQGGPQ